MNISVRLRALADHFDAHPNLATPPPYVTFDQAGGIDVLVASFPRVREWADALGVEAVESEFTSRIFREGDQHIRSLKARGSIGGVFVHVYAHQEQQQVAS